MDENIRQALAEIRSRDQAVQGRAYRFLLETSEGQVDWASEAWDDLRNGLSSKDNRLRSIASQLLCNLAASDNEGRILEDLGALVAVTRDERFVTARHCLQSLWKIGLAGEPQKQRILEALRLRFEDCAEEKNGTLIRFDILESLRKLYDRLGDEAVREQALALIGTEPDPKYRKKYAGAWKM